MPLAGSQPACNWVQGTTNAHISMQAVVISQYNKRLDSQPYPTHAS